MRTTCRIAYHLAVVICSLLAVGCDTSRSSASLNSVKLGFLPITADVALFTALERGYFENQGIVVEPIRFSDANQAMNALIAGQIDGAIMIGYSTLLSINSKSPDLFRIVQSGVETEEKYTSRILVPPDSAVQSLEQLKGRSIGTYSGATQRLNLILILSRVFANPEKDVQIVQVESNLQLPSLSAGRFDALFTIDPQATIAIQKGIGRSICDSPRAKYIVKPFPTCATVFSQALLHDRPETAARTLKALYEATAWAVANPLEAARITANPKYTEVSEDTAVACGTYEWWNLGQEQLEPVQQLADIMHKEGLLTDSVSVSALFADPSVLTNVP